MYKSETHFVRHHPASAHRLRVFEYGHPSLDSELYGLLTTNRQQTPLTTPHRRTGRCEGSAMARASSPPVSLRMTRPGERHSLLRGSLNSGPTIAGLLIGIMYYDPRKGRIDLSRETNAHEILSFLVENPNLGYTPTGTSRRSSRRPSAERPSHSPASTLRGRCLTNHSPTRGTSSQ